MEFYYGISFYFSTLVYVFWSSGVIELQTGRALHRLDAVLESVVVFRVASRAVAEVVVPLGFAEACFFPRRPVVLGVGSRRGGRIGYYLYITGTRKISNTSEFHGTHSETMDDKIESKSSCARKE